MSAVVIIAADLRERIAQLFRDQARDYPTSAAARIKEDRFNEVVLAVATKIDHDLPLDVSATAWLGRVLASSPELFERRRPSISDHITKYWKHP